MQALEFLTPPLPNFGKKNENLFRTERSSSWPSSPNPTYPDRPNTLLPQKLQASRNWMAKESKKRNMSQQAGRRQYKMRLIEKLLVLSRALTTLIPITTTTTATTTLPTMSDPMTATTTWPSTSSTTVNLFFSNPSSISRTLEVPKPQTLRLWPRPYNKEDTLMPILEEKQKARKLDPSKLKYPLIREITTSHPILSAIDKPTTASIMVTTSTPSPAKMCKRWGLPCPFCAQSTQHPSPVDSDWSEEDWDGEREEEGETKEGGGDGAKARGRRKGVVRFKLLSTKPCVCAQLWGRTPCPSERFDTKTGPGGAQRCETKWKRKQDGRGQKNSARTFRWGKDLVYYSNLDSDSNYDYQTYV